MILFNTSFLLVNVLTKHVTHLQLNKSYQFSNRYLISVVIVSLRGHL